MSSSSGADLTLYLTFLVPTVQDSTGFEGNCLESTEPLVTVDLITGKRSERVDK